MGQLDMWQSSSGAKGGSPRRKQRPIHIQRVTVELRPLDAPLNIQTGAPQSTDARLLLNDLSPKGATLFAAQGMKNGQPVAIVISAPEKIYLTGIVVWCQDQDRHTHVISEEPFPFRLGVEFTFENEEAQNLAKDYYEQINKILLPRPA